MMKRKKGFHIFMAAALCVMLTLINLVLTGGAGTVLAAGKNLGSYKSSVSKSFQTIPPKVQGLTAKSVVAGKAEITWNLDYGQELSGYQVYYATSKSGKYKKLATVNTNACKAELTGGKTYYIKVRAYAKKGDKTYYGKYTKAVKVTVLKAQSKINIIDSGKAYGNYIRISDIPEEITKQMKYLYPTGVFTKLSVQYVDKTSKSERWVDFFAEVTEKNNPVIGANEEVGYYSFTLMSSDDSAKINDHYKAMKPDGDRDFDHEKVMQYGVFLVDVKENPAVYKERVEQNYLDAKEDGYLTIIFGGAS